MRYLLQHTRWIGFIFLCLILQGCVAYAAGYALGTARVMAEDTAKRTIGLVVPRD